MQNYAGFLIGTMSVFSGWILQAWLAGRFKLAIPENVRPAAELALHITSGTILFALVFSAAAAINFVIDFFVKQHLAPNWIVAPTEVLEAVVWVGDVLAFLLFTAVQLLTFCRQMAFSAKSSGS